MENQGAGAEKEKGRMDDGKQHRGMTPSLGHFNPTPEMGIAEINPDYSVAAPRGQEEERT